MDDTEFEQFYDWLRQQKTPGKHVVALMRRLVTDGLLTSYLVVTRKLDGKSNAAIYAGSRAAAVELIMKILPQVVKNESIQRLIRMLMLEQTATLDCSTCDDRERCSPPRHHQPDTPVKPEEVN